MGRGLAPDQETQVWTWFPDSIKSGRLPHTHCRPACVLMTKFELLGTELWLLKVQGDLGAGYEGIE